MNFRRSTSSYESWLARYLTIVPDDLTHKHEAMSTAIFPFFRATFYRFAQLWPEVCPESKEAPQILAVGDLHLENFGTWRDLEGRLIWGINDFDEATRMPYTIDLVRLAASAHLAIAANELTLPPHDACGAILSGYQESLEAGGRPWVLGGRHPWLYEMVKPILRDPPAFWTKLESLKTYTGRIPGGARRALERMMAAVTKSEWRIVHRVAGMGSLGRQRFVAIAEDHGGSLCREAKALAPSAWDWAKLSAKTLSAKSLAAKSDTAKDLSRKPRYQKVLDTSVRAIDPFVQLQGKWIVRRLAPDCSKINIAAFPREKDETRLLHAMGWETANIHIGSGQSGEIHTDLTRRPQNWLHKAAERMVSATQSDFDEWRSTHPKAVHEARPTPAR